MWKLIRSKFLNFGKLDIFVLRSIWTVVKTYLNSFSNIFEAFRTVFGSNTWKLADFLNNLDVFLNSWKNLRTIVNVMKCHQKTVLGEKTPFSWFPPTFFKKVPKVKDLSHFFQKITFCDILRLSPKSHVISLISLTGISGVRSYVVTAATTWKTRIRVINLVSERFTGCVRGMNIWVSVI